MTWQINFTVADEYHEPFADWLEDIADSMSLKRDDDNTPWEMFGVFEEKPDAATLHAGIAIICATHDCPEPQWELNELPDEDWLARVYAEMPPIRAGRFFIYGSHYDAPLPPSITPIHVDAATAFGSGDHPTTYGCLLALHDYLKSHTPRHILDMGCGSGILGIGLTKRSPARGVGIDIHAPSVKVAQDNARLNGVAARFRCATANGFASKQAKRQKPYNVIVANILARPLCLMAKTMPHFLHPNGTIILSGLLNTQENRVLAAYRQQGLHLSRRYRIKGWSTLVLHRG